MTTNAADQSARERRLDEVATAYLKAVEAGERPQPQQWIERHPDLADDLRAFFSAQQQMDAFAPKRNELPGERTVGLEATVDAKLGTVRYFGDYELIAEIARGGMGVVFKARQVSLNRIVALKMILAGHLASDNDVQRFRAEAEAVANLDHPNIVPIYEVGEHDRQQYFSMKLMEGGSLVRGQESGVRSQETKEGQRSAVRLLVTVARAVQHAHQRGILHRDLKPANILLDKQGQPHVTDFGLAKRVQADESLSQSGTIVGTPLYMSPEQAAGKKGVTTAADIYSLGAILYELLAGKPPFQADTPLDVLMQVVEKEPPALRGLNPVVDADLETICMKCLRKEPARRYHSAEAFADDLERWLAGKPIEARPIGTPERLLKWAKRKPAAAALVGVSATAVLLVAILTAHFLNVLFERNTELRQAGADLVKQRDKARDEEANARNAEIVAKDKEDQAVKLLDRSRRMLMSNQLLKIAAVYRQNPVHALTLLNDKDACPPDLRDDFAWRFYHSHCQRWRVSWEWPKDAVDLVAVSPDGKLVAGAKGTVIIVWDLNTGKKIKTLEGHKRQISRLIFAPNSQLLASGAGRASTRGDGLTVDIAPPEPKADKVVKPKDEPFTEIRVWDVAEAKPRFAYTGQEDDLAELTFNRDSRIVAAGYFPKSARVWEIESGKEIAHLPDIGPGVVLSPDGKQIAAEYKARLEDKMPAPKPTLEVWDVETKQRVENLTLENDSSIFTSNPVFIKNGKGLAIFERGLRLWTFANKTSVLNTSRLPFAGVEAGLIAIDWSSNDRTQRREIALSHDGEAIATVYNRFSVVVWSVERGEAQFAVQGNLGEIEQVFFMGNELAIVQRSRQGVTSLRVWSPHLRTYDVQYQQTNGAAFLPGDKGLVTVGKSGVTTPQTDGDQLFRIDLATGKQEILAEGLGHNEHFVIAASPDGSAIALGAFKKKDVVIWDVAKRSPRFKLNGVFITLQFTLQFSPDSSLIAFGGHDRVSVYDARTGEPTNHEIAGNNRVPLAAFAPDGQTLAVGADNLPIQLWDLPSKQLTRTLSAQLFPLRYLPDGNLIGVELRERDSVINLSMWDPLKDKEVCQLGKLGYPPFVHVSSDGKTLVKLVGAEVEVWDLASRQARLKLPVSEMGMVALSPDSRFLAFAGLVNERKANERKTQPGGGSLLIWDTQPIEEKVIRP